MNSNNQEINNVNSIELNNNSINQVSNQKDVINDYKQLIKLNKEITSQIKENNYDIIYEYYLIKQPLTLQQKYSLILKTHGISKILKHSFIYGECIYNLIHKIQQKENTFNIYFYSQEIINEILQCFNDFIIEKTDKKVLILYQDIQLILHIKKLYKNQLELILNKSNHKYNCCLINNILYYSPITYYILKNNINPYIGNVHNIKLFSSIVNDIDKIPDNNQVNKPKISQTKQTNPLLNIYNQFKTKYKDSIDNLYISLLVLDKFDYFKIFIKDLPKDFFTKNYVIFELIKRGKLEFFETLNNYEKQLISSNDTQQQNVLSPSLSPNTLNKLFDLNTLNQDGLTPPEYCIYRANELINSPNIPVNIKEQVIKRYKIILGYLLFNRNNNYYVRNIIFFDTLLQTNFIKHNNNYEVFYEEVNKYLKNRSSNLILDVNNSYSIKHLNTLYLSISYTIINGDNSFIGLDNIIEFILINKDFIDINSILQVCKSYKSKVVLKILIEQNIIKMNNFNFIKIYFDLGYYDILKSYIKSIELNLKNILLYLVDTYNLEGLLFVNEHFNNCFSIKLNNNNTLLHYIVSKEEENDEKLLKQISIIKDVLYMFEPKLINTVNNDNESPIFYCKKPEIFKELLNLNSDITLLNKSGLSIIHKLIIDDNQELLNVLINHNKNYLMIKDSNENIPLIFCFKYKIMNYVFKLMAYNFNYSNDIKQEIQNYFDLYNINIKIFKNSDEFKKYYILINISNLLKN